MTDRAQLRAQADAMVRAFVTFALRAEVEDAPLLRHTLGSVAAPTSPDGLTRSLAEVRPRAPAMLAGCSGPTRAALDRLGALIEDLDRRTDQELVDELRAFAYEMMAALEPTG